ncbi:MAG: FAD/NAD(P)-binding oxidoreductase [Planctomycetota bacterium]
MRYVILGNGVTGASAAFRLRELDPDATITMVSGESTHHYSRPALMYIYMGHMTYKDTKPFEDFMWEESRIDLVRRWVTKIDHQQKQIETHGAEPITYDKLLLAIGSKPNKFGWPGQDLPGVQGLYDLLDLKLLYENTESGCEHAVLVGGGLIGIELAEMLLSRGIRVTFLVREASFWNRVLPDAESAMINELIRHHGIDLRLETELKEIHAGDNGRVSAITTGSGERLDCQLVGLTAGVSPNISMLEGSGIDTGRGILVDKQLRTSINDVWAAGDCAEIQATDGGRNTLQQVWYTGKMQGRHAAETMCGSDAEYDSGIWYNSAKFFDLEYQTYGLVNFNTPGEQEIFWRHPTEHVLIRIVHKQGKVFGFNFMGTRYRHEVCERWLADETPVEEVVPKLKEAAFDPEFFTRYEEQAQASLLQQFAEQTKEQTA